MEIGPLAQNGPLPRRFYNTEKNLEFVESSNPPTTRSCGPNEPGQSIVNVQQDRPCQDHCPGMGAEMNRLYFGDNLHVLGKYIGDETVDLIYLDPPFNSKATYNILYKSPVGSPEDAMRSTFKDTWKWEDGASEAMDLVRKADVRTFNLLQAMHSFMGDSDVMAYLAMMAVRLLEMHRVLKQTGTLYLHCDPTASHYLKILLDGIFGGEQFRNEIIWQRTNSKGHAYTRFSSAHDIIFAYSKDEKPKWNAQFLPHSEKYIESHYSKIEPETGRHYMLDNCLNPNPNRPNLTYEWHGHTRVWRWTKERMQANHDAGRLVYTRTGMPRYKRYLDEMKGTPITDVWTDIFPLNSQAQERLHYQTQKPIALLERIIAASSDEGDLVLDPFCGCGTTVEAAERLKRNWIGIDVTYLAVQVIQDRLKTWLPNAKYIVTGIPKDEFAARNLAKLDPYTFQQWAVSRVGGQVRGKGPDKGVDGEVAFVRGPNEYGRAIVSVKAGKNLNPDMVRALKGVVERERADMGIFICLDTTPDMRKESANSDRIELPGGTKPKIQLVNVKELVAGPNLGILTELNTLRAAQAAKETHRKRTPKPPTPDEIRRSPTFKLPIAGGSKKDQKNLPLPEPLLVESVPKKRGRR